MTPLDEAEVIRLLASPEGRQKVFPMIVDQYSQSLYWKIRSIVLTHEDADDVLQNTFLKAWKSLPTFQGKAKLSTWLYRIAINESLNFLRHQKTAALSSADADLSVANRLLADDYFDGDKSQAADEGQAVDDPAHGGCVLSGCVRGCSVVLGCLGMALPAQNCAIPRAALMP